MEDKHYAVLIDADNISSKYIAYILDEMTKYGVITYKRIYGDWTSPQAGRWKDALMENSIVPIQQFRNTVGKNATDSTLIIDAMDILYTGNVDGFCIVSSDGDFTRLASRLKESGMDVIGMGENKTPRSFRAACSVFTDLELLLEAAEEEEETPVRKQKRIPENIISHCKTSVYILSLKLSLKMTTRADRQDWARLAAVCRRNIRILMSETTDTVRCLHLSRKLIISTYRKSTIP